ncbi:hypothetical protein PTSG_05820 [Salpingoeca rosetta]|uniref:Transcription factor CBF/NF-Y/archaeal histone domain-containing protein n=1 Tax=Salpingoeca rosetta (strain ATCC 50818 / BSB-021) TaxID=946362 RepID=F2UCW1_SALR5|nr:uncharacterized protein PTSG_05820 [Salpingoeca rosetta]EGD74456.1 hypothetical protein PTSG_05820 [Salpingoeca rosetta]|eukprot:XP_004992713.1 hypothetical protein PTSG_05820 [Salpingoeca rosetta]
MDDRLTQLPVSRIKAAMRKDPDVQLVAPEAAVLIAKATELFIAHMARCSFDRAQQVAPRRKTVQTKDIEHVLESKEEFLFLEGIQLWTKKNSGGSIRRHAAPKHTTNDDNDDSDDDNDNEDSSATVIAMDEDEGDEATGDAEMDTSVDEGALDGVERALNGDIEEGSEDEDDDEEEHEEE